MKPIRRIAFTGTALLLGGVLIFTLTFVGDRTKGPIEDAFSGAGEWVRGVEGKMIIDKRTKTRAAQLEWLKKDARLLHSPKTVLLGAYDANVQESFKPVFDLEERILTTFPLIHIYAAWGSKESQRYPDIQVESIHKSGSIPLITWEPWLTDFDPALFPGGLRPRETRDKGGLSDVAKGVYDSYIRTWARAASKAQRPILLRLGHEMNDPYRYPWGPQNNKPEEFIEAWKHVFHIFEEENANNVLWVWSPHPAYGWFEYYYPGTQYVDWVGVGVLNYGTVAPWSKWWTFDEIFGKHYPELSAFQKPIMISEFGSLAVGGDRPAWYTDALEDLPELYPLVKALLFFHVAGDVTTTQQALDWTIYHDPEVVSAVIEAIKNWKQ